MEFDLNKVYPWIKSVTEENGSSYITSYAQNGEQGEKHVISENIPWHIFGDDVGVFYVFDNGDNFTLVQNSMLPEGMTEDELYGTACRNLWNDVEFRIQQTNYGSWGVLCGGNFEASSILLLNVMNTIGEQYGGDFYFAVPARDMMVTAAADDKEQIAGLEQMVDNIVKNGESPISRTIFQWEYRNEH